MSQRRRYIAPPGISRHDSDDELGSDDLPWEWIYSTGETQAEDKTENGPGRKRKRRKVSVPPQIVGARLGAFECSVGDCVLLKAEGSNEAWVAMICEFVSASDGDGDEDEKSANLMWFSTEKEIRNKDRKRTDFYSNELYISPSWDINPLASINGKARVMSPAAFFAQFPSGKIPRHHADHGKVFICRRGCNTRTATYTDEFVWEDIYRGGQGIDSLIERVTRDTKARRRPRAQSPGDHGYFDVPQTPSKSATRAAATTPQSKRTKAEPGSRSQRKTPTKRLEFTPLATRRLSPSNVEASPYQIARNRLHVSSVPPSLPCREAEFSLVYSSLEAAITEGSGNCIYISGTPGTGKTATVRDVISRLDLAVRSDELDDFIFVEINGMKITDPHHSYSLLWEALRGQRVSPAQALDLLQREFTTPSPRRVPCVVLMDELDQLVTKNQAVMYNFFNWPTLPHSRLIVLAVANTMDLPERTLSNKISSRLGLTRITFPGYTHDQLIQIIQSRLQGVPGDIVDADAIQFASRKVAAVSGDARRALDMCRRAVELAEAEVRGDPSTPTKSAAREAVSRARVTIGIIKKAIKEATTSPVQQHLHTLPLLSKLFMAALLLRIRRSGLMETTFGETLDELRRAVAKASPSNPAMIHLVKGGTTEGSSATAHLVMRPAYLHAAAMDLVAAGLIHLEGNRAQRCSKLRLAISDDEVRMALRDDGDLKDLVITL